MPVAASGCAFKSQGISTPANPLPSGWVSSLRSLWGSVIDRSPQPHGDILSTTLIEEIVMKLDSKSGATLAAAAATLFLAGSVVSTVSTSANAAQGKCMAGNACKGQSACKGSANACKGQNACK